ncbi:MAG: hypothetical protein V1752_02780, partial [Candidatus Firestonebacteria bacterium]
MFKKILAVFGVVLLLASYAQAKDEVIESFEDEADLDLWMADDGVELVSENATEGAKSAKVEYKADLKEERRFCISDQKFGSLFNPDWSTYKSMKVDIFNDSDKEGLMQIRIKSNEHMKKWGKAYKLPSKKQITIEVTMKELSDKINLNEINYLG